ncbi:uncharacterized protein KD926_004495 [Aspergillus affinis]|uniref:uncharacterized protein n=1 Tax=Aspergillus affinis TaxID=1070780 RepID=UPI0022FF061C|nr:uncharacterized protein KD926_004495 [Aspergillus affinis]KAI9035126.1 hypothetical protein KD926_004495 [Aspergillus affinis]
MITLQFSSDEDGLDNIINADNDTLEDIDQKNTLARFDLTEISNLKGICTALETVTSVKELKKWLKGTLFRPYFLYCYLHAILPAQSSGNNMNQGKSFTTIIARIHAAANSGNTKYLNHFSDKTNWDRADWIAFCLLTLVNVNTRNVDGIFYKKAWTQEHKEKVIEPYWQFHLIELCLRLIEEELAEEPAPDASDTGNTKLPHKDNMQDEADEISITLFKVLMATAGPYSIYYPTGQKEAYKDTPDGRVTLSQCENHEEACEALNISNPDVPKYPAIRINTSFRFWQPVAIYAIVQFRENPLLSGCILADMRAITLKDKPTLIICPPYLVWQWAAEIKAVTKRLKVIVYFGNAREDPPVDVKVIPKLAGNLSWMTGPQAHHAVKQFRRYLFVQTREGQIIWNMAKYRELTLVITWLFFRYCYHLLVRASARFLDTQARHLTLGPQLIKKAIQVKNQILMRKYTEDTTAPAPVTHDIPEQFTDQNVLLYLLRGSPKLRALLSIIQQEQFFIAAAFYYACINCRVFHSELNSKERIELVRDFTTKVDECMVLICSYYVNAAGSNLQNLCRNVYLFNIFTSDSLKQQAIGRVNRVGQTRTVKIYDYIVSDSFNASIFAKNLTKAVPDLVVTLNWDMFTDTLDVTGDSSVPSFNIDIWVLNQDNTISKVRHALMELVPKDQRLSPEDVVKALISTMKASSRIREMSDIDVQYLEGEEAKKDSKGPIDITEDVPRNVAEGSDPKKKKADKVKLF